MFVTIVAPAPCAASNPGIQYRARLDTRTRLVLLQVKFPWQPQFKTEARCTVEELDQRLERHGRTRTTATHDDLASMACDARIQDILRKHSYRYSVYSPPAR